MDFGIARATKGKSITGSGVMIGTPQYMSPEQVEWKDVDQRSDIYSLGIILYEMLTDRVPFEGDTPLTVGVKQKTEIPKDPKDFNERIQDDLNLLILKCLEKGREGRFQSAEELRSELERIEQGIPTTDRVIPKKKTLTSREITVQLSMKKLIFPAIAVLVLIAVGLILWRPWLQKVSISQPSDKPSLAVVYFENNTGDNSLDNWCKGLADLITDDLSQSKLLKVLSGDRLYTILNKLDLLEVKSYSSEALKKVGELAGVQNILRGSFNKAGETIRISTRLQNINTGDLLGTRKFDCQGEEGFFAAVDELTRVIKTDLKLAIREIAGDVDKDVGMITTNSPEAYRYYSEGMKYHLMSDHKQSIPFLERAISIDPEFAMAYRCLAVKPLPLEKKREYIQKALDYSDRVSEGERMWIQANYYGINGYHEKAIEAFKELYEFNSAQVALSTIARSYQDLGEWDKAIEYFEASRNEGDEWRGTYTNLGNLYEAKEMYSEAREVYEDYIFNIHDDAAIHGNIASTYVFEGKYDLALKETDKALALDPTSVSKSEIYHLQGDFDSAEKGYKSWLEDERMDWKLSGWYNLEILYRTLGRYDKATKEAHAGLEYAQKNNNASWQRWFNDSLA
jgi:tetratricopeptide (TPR) repeat protein